MIIPLSGRGKAFVGSRARPENCRGGEDGLQAVQLTEKFRPKVLIVDIMMPGLNGSGGLEAGERPFSGPLAAL